MRLSNSVVAFLFASASDYHLQVTVRSKYIQLDDGSVQGHHLVQHVTFHVPTRRFGTPTRQTKWTTVGEDQTNVGRASVALNTYLREHLPAFRVQDVICGRESGLDQWKPEN